jgi:hypothetical protein
MSPSKFLVKTTLPAPMKAILAILVSYLINFDPSFRLVCDQRQALFAYMSL